MSDADEVKAKTLSTSPVSEMVQWKSRELLGTLKDQLTTA
jgi:hypothetical protein